jgi:predicted GNAT family acetyltransferase
MNCVAALCSDVFASGKTYCSLYADANNPTSNRLYSALGFEEIGTTQEFLFQPDAA